MAKNKRLVPNDPKVALIQSGTLKKAQTMASRMQGTAALKVVVVDYQMSGNIVCRCFLSVEGLLVWIRALIVFPDIYLLLTASAALNAEIRRRDCPKSECDGLQRCLDANISGLMEAEVEIIEVTKGLVKTCSTEIKAV